ncbi:PucR C-terminal helix-turn-helix domain-containing protein [Micromonospora sediminicola]|uniref:PucR C-terminal helix-turn-helix domain-containing protein n=1 Tax=Micromonospora sediminicola TaxID=946078 RepID=A0A1A9BG72_9ACTN|nr:helix-turn-helix domain-containing protein [Micromonospora sediminicola]SBT67964.1 PucR C-terminal helix-turn-helix domain-containing protein [Micromonospora sediminicola]
MTRTGSAPAFGALLRHLAADAAAVDEVARAARANSPEVARLPAAEVRRQVVLLLTSGLGALERREDPAGRDFTEARRLGADRAAQGVSVAGLLRGVQAGRDRAVELVVRHGRDAGIPDEVLVEGLLTIGRYAAAVERAVVDGHREAERELVRSGPAARAHLLRRLLIDGPDDTPAAELARFGLRPDGRYHCLVAAAPDPVRAHTLHRQLARHGGLLGAVEDRLAGLLPRLPGDAPADLLALVTPAQPLARAPAMYALCRAALRTATHRRLRGLRQVTDLAGETALAAQPALAELLRATLLGPLDPADEFHRELATTALAWLDHGQRLDQTAAALHVHPNTVRYRLRRLREVTGGPPVEEGARCTVPQTVHWWWALRSWLDGC